MIKAEAINDVEITLVELPEKEFSSLVNHFFPNLLKSDKETMIEDISVELDEYSDQEFETFWLFLYNEKITIEDKKFYDYEEE